MQNLLPRQSPMKLREMIRLLRACSTLAEERELVAKVCAEIRSALQNQDDGYRHRHMAKLLYIHMLGYPTHFGQIEAMKLVASSKFGDKRIGYLALMLLLDENQDVLMLVTNSMKNDMAHKNPFVVGMALCALGNVSSTDIARDLSRDVAGFFSDTNSYVRKKAALCAMRIVRKVPDLAEDFIDITPQLLSDKSHAVQLTGCTLMLQLTKTAPECIDGYRVHVDRLVGMLKAVWLGGAMSEYDVQGISDPFLHTAIVRLLRVLGEGDVAASGKMNEILAQLVINTDSTKVAGAAILYECAQTIMSIEAEGGLRVLAINVLGKFLQSRDNNNRYVALNTLCKVVHRDADAIQRHRATVVDCLKDPDLSIRRRALNLITALVTKSNVRVLTKELLQYLANSATSEFKDDLTEKICIVVDRFAPSRVWHIANVIQVLCTAGGVRDDVVIDLVSLISRSKELHAYAVHEVFRVLNHADRLTQQPLALVALWAIGEYGDLLVSQDGAARATHSARDAEGQQYDVISMDDVLSLLEAIMDHPDTSETTQQAILTTLVKLIQRASGDTAVLARVQVLLAKHSRSIHVELQQRAVEYGVLGASAPALRNKVLARMPTFARCKKTVDSDDGFVPVVQEQPEEESEPTPEPAPKPAAAPALDILSDIFSASPAAASTPSPATATSTSNVFDIFEQSSPSLSTSAASPAPSPPAASPVHGDIMDMFSAPAPTPVVEAAAAPTFPDATVYDAQGLKIVFSFDRNPAAPSVLTVTASYTNSNSVDIHDFDFQVAVPPHIKRDLRPATGKTLPARNGGAVTQTMVLTNEKYPEKKTLMKARVVYTVAGESKVEQLAIAQFPH